MTAVGWLPAPTEELFGTEATAEESYELFTVDVPPTTWLSALRTARDDLGCTYFDWLSAVDEPGTGFRVSAHVVALSPVRRLLVRTTVPHETPVLPTAVDVYAGAAWHERETHEMFGVDFEGHPALDHLLLPETFEGHPLRKDFVLAARVAKAWPGAKEPGESDHGGPKRRQMLPPGVPDPNEWGPLKGQLPPAPARPARGTARAAGDRPARATGDRPVRAAGDRPARRARTASEGSASQATPAESAVPPAEGAVSSAEGQAQSAEGVPAVPPAQPRRARSASEGSASQARETGTGTGSGEEQASETPAPPRRARSASEGSASHQATGTTTPRRSRSASDGSASQQPPAPAPASSPAPATEPAPAAEPAPAREGTTAQAQPSPAPRSADAPWHHARPAFDEPEPEPEPEPKPKLSSAKEMADEPSAEADSAATETGSAATEADAPVSEAGSSDTEPTPAAADPTPEDPTPDTPAGGSQ
nr:NADH-quinone oxidoreductase subunit C [Streptomyces sp. NBC_00886]